MNILKEAQAIGPQIIEDRRTIHQNPELGMELPKTVAYVKQRLTEMGYEPQDCGGGVVVTVGKPGKCILLRADMDALPMKEETGLPFASQNGAMHSCGHDGHTAMLLGAAKLLKDHEQELNGTVKLMFQPAEEILAGAECMVQEGVLENPKVDVAMAFHIDPQVPVGKVLYGKKYMNASADAFTFHIKGVGGHGAMPENAVDPLVTAAYLVIALQEIQSREISGKDLVVLTFGVLQSGEKENIIPSTAQIRGTVRALDGEVLAKVKNRMEEIGTHIGAAFRSEVTLTWDFGCAPNSNNEELVKELYEYQAEIFGADGMVETEPSMGSEDFASVSSRVPSVYGWLGVQAEGEGGNHPIHSPHMILNETALPMGVAAYANCAIRWLEKNG